MSIKRPKYQPLPDLPPDEFAALKADIAARGIQITVIQEEHGNTLDGHQRERAARELHLRHYPVKVMAGLTEEAKWEYALAVNIKRRNLTTAQKRMLIEQELRRRPDRANRWIAETLGVATHTVLAVRRRLESTVQIARLTVLRSRDGRGRPSQCPTITVQRNGDIERAQRALRDLGTSAPGKPMDLKSAERRAREYQIAADRDKPITVPAPSGALRIVHGDFRCLKIADGAAGMIFTDPPYGKEFLPVWDDLAAFAARVLRPGGMLVSYSGTLHLDRVLAALGRHLRFHWLLALLHDGSRTAIHDRHVFTCYKPILVFSKGKAASKSWVDDVIQGSGGEKDLHDWQQSVGEAVRLIEPLSEPGDLIVDPFGGSFSTAEAVLRVGGGRRFLGCDVDRACVVRGRERLARVRGEMRGARW